MFTLAITSLYAQDGLKVGDEAANFKLVNAGNTINGIDAEVSLEDYNNAKGYIIVFTCNECEVSVAYEDRLIALHRKFALEGYPVIAINPNDSEMLPEESYESMKIRAKEKNFPFAYLNDATQDIALEYGVTETPHVFVVQKKKGTNIIRYIGAIDDNTFEADNVEIAYLEEAVNLLLAGDLPKRKMTKSDGCSIKWGPSVLEAAAADADAIPVTKKN